MTLRPRQCKMSYHLLGPIKEPFTEHTLERGLTQLSLFLFRHLILKILIVNIPALTLGLSQDFERYTADNPSS